MRRRWLIPLLLLSLGLNAGFLVIRFRPRRRPPQRPPHSSDMSGHLQQHLSRMTDHLGLTEEQQGKLQAVYDRSFPAILEASTLARDRRRALAECFGSIEVKAGELKAMLENLGAAHAALDSAMADIILSESSILTSEQRRLYLEEIPWGQSREGAGGPPPGRGPGGGRPGGRPGGGPPGGRPPRGGPPPRQDNS